MKTLDSDISNLIKQSNNLNHRTTILLTGDNRWKKLGIVCNFSEKLGTKNILYLYVKDNKKRKMEVKGKKRKSICHNIQINLQKHCSSEIRWCLYKESQKILGKTFDICIFQDYELLTPNVIARGMETVSGGGLIIFLAPALHELESYFNSAFNSSLNHLSDTHRFLKRFTVSLISSKICVCLDDHFNLLNKKKKPIKFDEDFVKKTNYDLISLKDSLKISDSSFYPMVNVCATYDQARCLRALCSAIRMYHHPDNKNDNDVRCAVTAVVTAARGRGKSAALGLALVAALVSGLNQICVTSPSPENITTLWQYVKIGLKALNYAEHIDFEITTSYLEDGVKAITKVELKKSKFTQIIRYISPSDTESIDCDLLCIDEAAAIPLSVLRMYFQSTSGLVFVSSTVSGYEGSGMTLSTKLIEELRRSYTTVKPGNELINLLPNTRGRLYEISLEEPIRYGNEDPVELFLFKSLCMNYRNESNQTFEEIVTPDQCQLVVINRDILFDCSKSSERLLQHIMSIYSASNHQNSPDELKSLADNECSRLLCLTNSPLDCKDPDVFVLIQISYEGQINRDFVKESILNGCIHSTVDFVSNLLIEEFLEPRFGQLSGLKIDVIATSPGYINRGFGSRALKLLMDFLTSSGSDKNGHLKKLSNSLLMPLYTLPKVSVNYVCTYMNLTVRLIRFFQRISDFIVIYVDPEISDITGECKGILMKRVATDITPDSVYSFNWLALFAKNFAQRYSLLRYGYLRELDEELKALLDNSSFVELKTEGNSLSKENIRSFSCI